MLVMYSLLLNDAYLKNIGEHQLFLLSKRDVSNTELAARDLCEDGFLWVIHELRGFV